MIEMAMLFFASMVIGAGLTFGFYFVNFLFHLIFGG